MLNREGQPAGLTFIFFYLAPQASQPNAPFQPRGATTIRELWTVLL
jgi:hypothetical protein